MKRNIKFILVVLAVLLFSVLVPTSYLAIYPGNLENLGEMVIIDDDQALAEDNGSFMLVTIAQRRATLSSLVWGWINPSIDLRHQMQLIPPDMDEEEHREILKQWMEESKLLAKFIALRWAGYEIEMDGRGAKVEGFVEDSPAKEVLREGDVILTVDEEDIYFVDQLLAKVQERQVGDSISITYQSNEDIKSTEVNTIAHQNEPDRPAIGVYITAFQERELNMPFDIDIDTGEIAGPSAGMMFVLEIIDQLEEENLTCGYKIAGTGTIDYFENVGGIGGVKQKVLTAEREGADYFIVPQKNYHEAVAAANKIEVVAVETLDEVMEFLKELNG